MNNKMKTVYNQIKEIGIIPVVVLEDANNAKKLGEALMEGGLKCAEVTFRTEAAKDTIKILSEEFPDMLVGAGTVLTTTQVDEAVVAGAKFVVSPGVNPKVVEYCTEKNIPIIPGICTPSNIETAMEYGLEAVKFFPAEASGGLKYIKAISAPYKNMKFMATGGINSDNVKDYLNNDSIFAVGGSWMVKENLIESGDFETIKELALEASNIVKEARA